VRLLPAARKPFASSTKGCAMRRNSNGAEPKAMSGMLNAQNLSTAAIDSNSRCSLLIS
jgi:hypothetical protein